MITHIDTVRAYHSGPRMIVEVDVVMHAEETLRATHDVAEDLQEKLESLPDVERAYVHVDFETSHKPVSSVSLRANGGALYRQLIELGNT
jgi:divalent metal cation (Fe/Co/Zn/Cd) transporter